MNSTVRDGCGWTDPRGFYGKTTSEVIEALYAGFGLAMPKAEGQAVSYDPGVPLVSTKRHLSTEIGRPRIMDRLPRYRNNPKTGEIEPISAQPRRWWDRLVSRAG